MGKDEQPGDDKGQEDLQGAFSVLGGQLTWDEFTRLPGSGVLVRQVALLLGGDVSTAEDVLQESFAALQAMGDPEPPDPHIRLLRSAANKSRYRGTAAASGATRDAGIRALLALPSRQREAIVLRDYMSLPEAQAAKVMCISTGAFKAHLARGRSSLS